MTERSILDLLPARKGHFLLESGHHGELWLDLELLCQEPRALAPLVTQIAERLAPFGIDAVCAPLVEGAFLGLMVAAQLQCGFSYTQRFALPAHAGLFPAGYRVPRALRRTVKNRRVALVNDVINAGSAVKRSLEDLEDCQAQVVVIASLLVLGDEAVRFAREQNTPLVRLAQLANNLWTPETCPLCAAGIALEDRDGFTAEFQSSKP
jgi:orotate phosphoribosyltransferase